MQERVETVRAADLADAHPGLGGCHLLHAAIMVWPRVPHVISADTGFDRLPDRKTPCLARTILAMPSSARRSAHGLLLHLPQLERCLLQPMHRR